MPIVTAGIASILDGGTKNDGRKSQKEGTNRVSQRSFQYKCTCIAHTQTMND